MIPMPVTRIMLDGGHVVNVKGLSTADVVDRLNKAGKLAHFPNEIIVDTQCVVAVIALPRRAELRPQQDPEDRS